MRKRKTMKAHITRTGKLVGGYVPREIRDGIEQWIASGPERDISTFVREAARMKLAAEGIEFAESYSDKASA